MKTCVSVLSVLGVLVAGHAPGMDEQLVAVALDEHPEGGKDHIPGTRHGARM